MHHLYSVCLMYTEETYWRLVTVSLSIENNDKTRLLMSPHAFVLIFTCRHSLEKDQIPSPHLLLNTEACKIKQQGTKQPETGFFFFKVSV